MHRRGRCIFKRWKGHKRKMHCFFNQRNFFNIFAWFESLMVQPHSFTILLKSVNMRANGKDWWMSKRFLWAFNVSSSHTLSLFVCFFEKKGPKLRRNVLPQVCLTLGQAGGWENWGVYMRGPHGRRTSAEEKAQCAQYTVCPVCMVEKEEEEEEEERPFWRGGAGKINRQQLTLWHPPVSICEQLTLTQNINTKYEIRIQNMKY